jgi:hypothetical protein
MPLANSRKRSKALLFWLAQHVFACFGCFGGGGIKMERGFQS